MREDVLKKYAELVVCAGVNVQKGQEVVISADIQSADFVRLVVEKAYDVGAASVFVEWADEAITRATYLKASPEHFKSVKPWRVQFYKDFDDINACYIRVISPDPDLLAGVEPERIRDAMQAAGNALSEHRKMTMGNHVRWSIAAVPSIAWARKLFPQMPDDEAVEALWDKIIEASRVGTAPLAAWQEHDENFKKRVEFLNNSNFKALHFTNSLGTDLRMELPRGHYWKGGSAPAKDGVSFFPNIPTEEVFSLPNCHTVSGRVVASMPLTYQGVTIEGFELEFEGGVVVRHKAQKNEDTLTNILSLDEGARRVGEIALVPHASPISEMGMLFYNTLIDENASCHLALGKAYPMVHGYENMSEQEVQEVGVNDSITHVDFMFGTSDMTIMGTTQDGRQVHVFTNGNWHE